MANVPISNLTTTWNNVSTAFNGIKLNVTDTASAAGSLLMDLQVGGVSRFAVGKNGRAVFTGSGTLIIDTGGGANYSIQPSVGSFRFLNSTSSAWIKTSHLSVGISDTGVLAFGNFGGETESTILRMDGAANTLAQRNGVNAQTNRIYGTYTDGSNYRRLTKTMSTGGVAEIKPEGAGTGASGNVLHISGLPTSNPGPGILWNNLGIVNVGT